MAFKYEQIRDEVIARATRASGNKVMSESQICREFKVSRATAMKALNALATERLVRREVGRGTFLRRRKVTARVHLLIDGNNRPFLNAAIRLAAVFSAANPDIQVEVEPVDGYNWVREIVTRPGVKVLCVPNTGHLSDAGFLEPFQELPDFDGLRERILGERIAWRRDADGAPLCDSLPLMLNPEVLVVHRGHAGSLGLDTVHGPADWTGLAAWLTRARRLTRHGQGVMGAALKKGYSLPLSYLCSLQDCRQIIRDDGITTLLAFERGEEWLGFFRDLHQSGAMPWYDSDRPDPVLFGNALTSPWASTWVISQQQTLAEADDLVVLPIPPPQRGQKACSVVGCTEVAMVRQLGISQAEKDAAWRLIRFLVGDLGAQRLLVQHFSALSVLRELHAEQRADPRFIPFVTALDSGILRSDHPMQHALLHIVQTYFDQCVRGDLTPRQAAARIIEAGAIQVEMHRLSRR